MLMVVLLVIMFTGLGMLAIRHTRGELRSAGAFMDSAQAAAAAETAVLMVATDMRRNWRRQNDRCPDSYYTAFQRAIDDEALNPDNSDTDPDNDMSINEITIGFSDSFNHAGYGDNTCDHKGGVPVPGLVPKENDEGVSLPAALYGPLAATAWGTDVNGDPVGVGPLAAGFGEVHIKQGHPIIAPPPPGFSSDEENRTYDWYYFSVTCDAMYGPESALETGARSAVRGRATVRSYMKIGPIDSIGSQ